MEGTAGALGTSWSLSLRMAQAFTASSSLLIMCFGIEFYSYSAFCFLVVVMGLVIPWASTLALLDMLSVSFKNRIHPPGILSIVLIGDWILSLLSLAASFSTTSVTRILVFTGDSFCIENKCKRYQTAAFMAFLSWFLLSVSSLINLWFLAKL
ncbi:hypothetical protein ABFS83_11G106600 [Erythranthe nasuta]